MPPPRIVVAPDKFKGNCTAREAAAAIVLGLRDAWGDAACSACRRRRRHRSGLSRWGRDRAVLDPAPAALAGLATIDASGLDPRLSGVALEIACEVANPLLGPAGGAAVHGPQKGAAPPDVAFLEGVLAFGSSRSAVASIHLRSRICSLAASRASR